MAEVLQAEPPCIEAFRRWFVENGGWIHPDVRFRTDETGLSVKTLNDLATDTTILSCPFSLAVTLENIEDALLFYCGLDAEASLSERQRICAYLSLHWIIPEDSDTSRLRHHAYLRTLPKPENLLTPLYFTTDELNLFHGTNLFGASQSQRQKWEKEWSELCETIRRKRPEIASKLTWDMYLASATYLSSRSFPSTLLSPNPSLVATPSSYQVLLPGIDSLNHARGAPVTWGISQQDAAKDKSSKSSLCISLTLNRPYGAGSELFNNYGPKPNSSLILGYGFALEDNPDDTILLKIGSRAGEPPSGVPSGRLPLNAEHEVGRDARGVEALWADVRAMVAASLDSADADPDDAEGDDDEHAASSQAAKDVQLDVQTADTLSNMVSDLLDRLPILPNGGSGSTDAHSTPNIRPEVRRMWVRYVQGQVDILRTLLGWIEGKEREAVRRAQELGIDVVFGDDDSDSATE